MAPIELDTTNSNLLPYTLFGSWVLLVGGLTALVGHALLRAYGSLPPSQSVRAREKPRRRHVQVLFVLALLSLIASWTLQLQTLGLSYDTWASERGVSHPTTLYGPGGIIGAGADESLSLQLGRWLRDTSYRLDNAEIAVERSRRFWWTQQVYLGKIAWGIFIGAEGLKRNIPHIWAFVALAQLVSLSYAQNLFGLAVLLAPVTLSADGSHHIVGSTTTSPKAVRFSNDTRSERAILGKAQQILNRFVTSKPSSWAPHPALLLAPLAVASGATFLLPFAAGTPSFALIQILPSLILFGITSLPYLVPEKWGSLESTAEQRSHLYSHIYKTAALVSLVFHLKTTVVALVDNTPQSHRHRHSFPFFSLTDDRRSNLERSRSAVGNTLGAVNDHPAVTEAAGDVMLSSISLAIWAALRGLDIATMLRLFFPFYPQQAVKESTKALVNGVKKTRRKLKNAESESTSSTPVKKTPRKRKATSEADETYIPDDRSSADAAEEGEESVPEEPESGALAWGLVSLGGVGAGMAGVLGADTIQNT